MRLLGLILLMVPGMALACVPTTDFWNVYLGRCMSYSELINCEANENCSVFHGVTAQECVEGRTGGGVFTASGECESQVQTIVVSEIPPTLCFRTVNYFACPEHQSWGLLDIDSDGVLNAVDADYLDPEVGEDLTQETSDDVMITLAVTGIYLVSFYAGLRIGVVLV